MKHLEEKIQIDQQCIGFTGTVHWAFQWSIFEKLPHLRNICILGVYYGRDTAYAATVLRHLHGEDYHITAVDLFSDAPCADWPEEKLGLSWEEAGNGPAPTREAAQANLETLGLEKHVTLVRQDALDFLQADDYLFDMIYIDTSHDYETTAKTIDLALPRLSPSGVLAGDDYSEHPEWGVVPAVKERCATVRVFGDWIWFAPGFEFKPPPKG